MLFRLQHVSYPVCDSIQFPPFGSVSIRRAKPHTETIAYITGKDVQMNVKYFLPRGRAVREADIDPFAFDLAITQRCGDVLRDAKHMRAFFRVEPRKVRGMSVGNYQRVPGIYGLVVQES
jgi:hypothetical protein